MKRPTIDEALAVLHEHKEKLPEPAVKVIKAYIQLAQIAEMQADNVDKAAQVLAMSAKRLREAAGG